MGRLVNIIYYCSSRAYFFAIKTRKIDHKDFKDTKKIIGFVFTMTLSGFILLPIIYILEFIGNINVVAILST